MVTQDMLMVVDRATNSKIDINDHWNNQVFGRDSNSYYDKNTKKLFTTLPIRNTTSSSVVQHGIWRDFW
jgi:hypothetical protein